MFVRRSVRDLLPGDHAWLPFGSPDEQAHVVGAWIEQGLRTRDRVIYVTDAEHWELPGLYGRDLRPAIKAGLLSLIPVGDACLTGGMFDPEKMLQTLCDELAKAEEQEFRGVRFTAETSWALAQPFGDTRVEVCEREIDERVAPSVTVTAICQTDVRRCSPAQFDLLSARHEVRVVPDPDFDDPVLSITRTYSPPGLRLRGELDAARHTHFVEALNSLSPGDDEIYLDLSELDFLSLGALRTMVEYTRRRGARSAVVLHRVPPEVRATLEVVGLHRLPGIRLDED